MDDSGSPPIPARRRRSGRYLFSLPERAFRSGAALLGGLVLETTEVLLPDWLRSSRLYAATMARILRITVELFGGVPRFDPEAEMDVRQLFVRKALGNVVEAAGIVAVGWSPLWLLAAAADLTGGARVYLRTLVKELKRDGLLPEGAEIHSVDELLTALEKTTRVLADTVDVPPLRVGDMRASWKALKENRAHLPSSEELAGINAGLHAAAERSGRSVRSLSGLIALDALRAGVEMGDAYIFDYYRKALKIVHDEGLGAYARRVARPYLEAALRHLDPGQQTWSERAVEAAIQRWGTRRQANGSLQPPEDGRNDVF